MSSVADRVVGEPDFATSAPCAPLSANNVCPIGTIAIDSAGHLYVPDLSSRVLEYDDPLSSSTADRVFGQPDSNGSCNTGGVSASSLCDPYGVAVDSSGRLLIADSLNHRR